MPSLHFEHALLPGGWRDQVRITVANGLIGQVQPDCPPQPDDIRSGYALPGMPNLHSHAFQRGMAGLSERRTRPDDSFWSWREIMYRFLDRMDPDDVEAVSAQAYVEMLEGGFTRVGEFHYLHNDAGGHPYANPAELASRIAAAAGQTGIRLTLLPCFYAHGDFGAAPPLPGQRRFLNSLDRYTRLLEECEGLVAALPGATLGLAPHSLRAVAPDELGHLVALAAKRPLHIHAAEQTREVEACVAWSGLRPVEWLLRHAPVGPRWCLIHATHMTDTEVAELARTGAIIGFCPLTEASLGDGIPAAEAWTHAGGRFGIGTDSNILIGVAEELRQLEYGQRLGTRRRNVLADARQTSTGSALFSASLAGGNAALDAPPASLGVGAPADIVALSASSPSFAHDDPDTLLDVWIFAGDRTDVTDVWCGGRHVVTGGRHIAADAIGARYRQCVRRLAARSP